MARAIILKQDLLQTASEVEKLSKRLDAEYSILQAQHNKLLAAEVELSDEFKASVGTHLINAHANLTAIFNKLNEAAYV